jgi:hypothetical protein
MRELEQVRKTGYLWEAEQLDRSCREGARLRARDDDCLEGAWNAGETTAE